MRNFSRRFRKWKISLTAAILGTAPVLNGCLDSDIGKRFREAWGPGAVDGLSNAITDPANAQIGFRQLGAALFDGLGAIVAPRTPTTP